VGSLTSYNSVGLLGLLWGIALLFTFLSSGSTYKMLRNYRAATQLVASPVVLSYKESDISLETKTYLKKQMNWRTDTGPLLFLMTETGVQPRHDVSECNLCNRWTKQTATTMPRVETVVRNPISSSGRASRLPFYGLLFSSDIPPKTLGYSH
jgi:hypothetical protein